MIHSSIWFCLPLILGIPACSPYKFEKPIEKFSAATTTMQDGFTSSVASARSLEGSVLQAEASAGRQRMTLAGCEASPPPEKPTQKRSRCRLAFAGPMTDIRRQALEQREDNLTQMNALEAKAAKAFELLTGYSEALSALANAKDRADFDAASNQLVASVTAVASFADPAVPGVSVLAGASAKGLLWLVGEALDAERRATLDWAVREVDPLLPKLADPMRASFRAVQRFQLSLSHRLLDTQVQSLGPNLAPDVYEKSLQVPLTEAAQHDVWQRQHPAAVVDKMLEAHAALLSALQDPEKNFIDLVTKVGEYASEAKAIREEVKKAA